MIRYLQHLHVLGLTGIAWLAGCAVKTPNGKKRRIFGAAGVPGPYQDLAASKIGAQEAEQRAIKEAVAEAVAAANPPPEQKEVPTFDEWFNGRFWLEWVIGRKNKPTEVRSKQIIYQIHLKDRFGDKRLNEIDVGEVARFRAELVQRGDLGEKRINNILAVLSKPLRYAVECELIPKAPKVGLFKVERPEIVAWDFAQYARLLAAAKVEGPEWYAAACLAGDAGLRIGEIKALRWREDVDMIAKTITVNQQTRSKQTTTPKGRTRRTIPMTAMLHTALKRLETIREGFVVRNLDGSQKTVGEADAAIKRICRRAGLPVHGFHRLRQSFGTHAALFGVNPWRLQAWMGQAAASESDPDARIIKMLGARGSHVAAEIEVTNAKTVIPAA